MRRNFFGSVRTAGIKTGAAVFKNVREKWRDEKLFNSIDDTDDVTKRVSTGQIAEIIGRRLTEAGGKVGDGISRASAAAQ